MTYVNDESSAARTYVAVELNRALHRFRSEAESLQLGEELSEWIASADRPRLTAAHFRLLNQLEPGGSRISDLAPRMWITKQALGQLAMQLCDRGFVTLEPDPGDRRAKLVRLTPAGVRAAELARRTAAMVEARWRREVGEERYAIFRAVLAQLVTGSATASSARAPSSPAGE
jgi:DNA-binding MarR family transcriptional regulator